MARRLRRRAAGPANGAVVEIAPCAAVREALSARLDGEESPLGELALGRHLRRCSACTAFSSRIDELAALTRRGTGTELPGVAPVAPALVAHGAPAARMRRSLATRIAMAALPLSLTIPALALGGAARGETVHPLARRDHCSMLLHAGSTALLSPAPRGRVVGSILQPQRGGGALPGPSSGERPPPAR